MPIHGKPQNREGRQHRSPEDDADRVAGLFLAGRDAGELADDELKVALCLGLLLTLRWREQDSNPRSPLRWASVSRALFPL